MKDTTVLQIKSLCHFMSYLGYAPVNLWDAIEEDEDNGEVSIDTTCLTQGFIKRHLRCWFSEDFDLWQQHYIKPNFVSLRDAQALHNGTLVRLSSNVFDMLALPHLNGKFTQEEINYAVVHKLVAKVYLQKHRVLHGKNFLKAHNMCVKVTALGKETDEYKLLFEGEE